MKPSCSGLRAHPFSVETYMADWSLPCAASYEHPTFLLFYCLAFPLSSPQPSRLGPLSGRSGSKLGVCRRCCPPPLTLPRHLPTSTPSSFYFPPCDPRCAAGAVDLNINSPNSPSTAAARPPQRQAPEAPRRTAAIRRITYRRHPNGRNSPCLSRLAPKFVPAHSLLFPPLWAHLLPSAAVAAATRRRSRPKKRRRS